MFWIFSVAMVMTVFNNFRTATGIACIILLLCVVTSTFCYSKIYLTLGHYQPQVQDCVHQGRQENGGGKPLNIARYRKTVNSALWVQMTLLACYLPYGIVGAVRAVTGSSSLDLAWDVTLSILLLNSTLNPLLYCWKIMQVRKAVKDTTKKLLCLLS